MCSVPGLPAAGSNVPVFISRVNLNPSRVLLEFWGNFDQDRKFEYQQMKKEIQCPGEGFCASDGSPGDLCLVHVYETWYRARIVSRDTDEYSVFLIDEGRTLRTTVSTLAWGKSDFFYLPPEVEFCVLANILPLSADNTWSTVALEFMKTLCGGRVNAFVQEVIVPHRTFLLDVPCLSRQMCEKGFAKQLSSDRFKEFVVKSLQPSNGTAEQHRTSLLRNKPLNEQKPQSYMYPELQTDTVETVVVTEVTSPFRIFCQLKVFSQELKNLTEQITQHYEWRSGNHFVRPETLGSPCASRGSDGRWYRSVLQQVVSSNNMVQVLHVDYGRKQFVKAENVRPLVSDFFRMPVVTYVCCLHGIVDRGLAWTTSHVDYLKSLLLNRTVIAKFQYQSLSEGVHYVTLYGEENTNINRLFDLKQKCTDVTLDDFAVQRRPSSQMSKPSERHAKNTGENYSDLKRNKPVFFQEHLAPNTSHVAVVQHVENPGKFWVQTQRYANEFNQLMNELEHLYDDLTDTDALIKKPVAGLLCAAKAQDGVFYRAAIYKIMDKKVEVYFLDYGNTEIVDCCNIQQLPLRFQQLPALAVRCSLHGIKSKLKWWDEGATSFFSKLVEDKVLDLHVQGKLQETHMVQLVDPSLDDENDIGKLLCRADLADGVVDKCAVRSCFSFRASVQPPTPPRSSFSTECASIFKEYLFPIGSSLEVTVSYIESPNDFWCQKATNAACLEVLMQDMQRFYAQSELQAPLEAVCVARHPETGVWYRALVIEKHRTPHVDVLFVDFGQTKKVAIKDLRKISPEFLKMKGQAFRCSLYNLIHPVSRPASDWSPESTSLFQEFVDTAASVNMPLKCTIFAVMYDSKKVVFNVVDLETPFQSICNLLVQRHLADRAPSKRSSVPPFRLDTYYYSTHDIRTGCEEEVSVTCVKSATQFFCHLAKHSAQIDKLADQVNSLCCQLEVTKCPQTFGTVCFVKFTDGLWYRGQIKSTKPLMVHFVDYGDTLEVDKSALLPVPIEAGDIMTVPVQAIECGLSDFPDDVASEVGKWFQNYAEGCSFRALIVAKEPGGKLLVELYAGKTQVNALIRQKFHNEIQRNEKSTFKERFSKNKNAQGVTTHVRESSNDLKIQQSSKSNLAQTGSSLEPEQVKYGFHKGAGPQKDIQRCHNALKPHESLQMRISNDACHLPYQSGTGDGVKTVVQTSLKESDLPVKPVTPGLEANVFISHCSSPYSFFVQLETDEDEIYSLVEKLNGEQLKCETVNISDIHEGDLVRAVFPDDNSWYRAAVREKTGGTINVEFVDFGNTAAISPSKICRLEHLFASFPRYSIHCSLNVDGTQPEIAPNFKRVIEQNVEKVMCTFVKLSQDVWEVKLDVNGMELGCSYRDESPPAAELQVSFYKNPEISVGQMITGNASFIRGPSLFWFQYATTDKLQEISDVLQHVGFAPEKLLEDSVSVGCACVARFTEDNLWYRVKVTSRNQNTLTVTFIDYGNESKVKVSEVRALPSELLDVPPQAFHCQLEGFNPSKGFWDEKADDKFFELINGKLLNITIMAVENSGTSYLVKLQCGGVVINDVMQMYWKGPSVDLLNGAETFTTDLKTQNAKHKQVDTQSTSENETEAQAEPLVMEDVPSSDRSVLFSKAHQGLQSTEDRQKEPFADVTGSLLDLTNHHENKKLLNLTSSSSSENLEVASEVCVVEEPETPSHEILQSDMGCIRRAAEMKPVGSECVIWSHVRRNLCRTQMLKVTEEAALVLPMEDDSEAVVDQLHVSEVLPEASLSAPADGASEEGPLMQESVEIQTAAACDSFELEQTRAPLEDVNTPAGEQRVGGAEMNTVGLLLDFLEDDFQDKVMLRDAGRTETGSVREELNDVSEDLIVLSSDDGESEAASDDTREDDVLKKLHPDTEEASCKSDVDVADGELMAACLQTPRKAHVIESLSSHIKH